MVCSQPAWDSGAVYTGGKKVSYNDNEYSANWWTQNERPDKSGAWSLIAACPVINNPSLDIGFNLIDDNTWDTQAVRRVLYTFAYGGQVSEAQIEALAALPPKDAIQKMLTFAPSNHEISQPHPDDEAKLWELTDGSMRDNAELWSSNNSQNPVVADYQFRYEITLGDYQRLESIWSRLGMSRGLNPFRQKIGLWETNYHMAANVDTGVNYGQIITYYDDILASLADITTPYTDTLTTAAASAAIATQYGHHSNRMVKDECRCNEDFAREYHQLFFGIHGDDDMDYHEEVSIKNTAKALTDFTDFDFRKGIGFPEIIGYGSSSEHYEGALEILGPLNFGNHAYERMSELSKVAIEHPESLKRLPVMIIKGLADDSPSADDMIEIRGAWNTMANKDLLTFLQAYAISEQFHDGSVIKYLTSVDRKMQINNQLVVTNNDIDPIFHGLTSNLESEQALPFRLKHNVFGAQTGLEAAQSTDVFRHNYNDLTEGSYYLHRVTDTNQPNWGKDWASIIPQDETENYRVNEVGEWLWRRFIGSDLANYGSLERAYVNALLATGYSLQKAASPDDLAVSYSTLELETDSDLLAIQQEQANTLLNLDNDTIGKQRSANRYVGQAIAFIVATPYIFARGGE